MRTRSRRGFTLVEVLVALLVMSLMAGLAWQGIDGIVRARDASQQRLERSLRLNTVLAQWQQDLAAIQQTPAVPALTFDGQTLRLTRRTGLGMQVVAWSRRDSVTGGVLLRWAGSPVTARAALQDQWMASQQLLGNEPGQLRVLTGVPSWQVYFFRNNAWSNAQSTGDIAAPAVAASAVVGETLPSGVRVAIDFDASSGGAGRLTRDVALGPQP
jgi:general secretion pathway protein J